MEQKFCQSCGMPMEDEALYGSESGGNKSGDYCKYCYENGAFTFAGSMQEMIENCVPHMLQADASMSPEQARGMMQQYFPSLKRWRAE